MTQSARFWLPVLVLLFGVGHSCAADLPRVPEGFTVELVADTSLVQHPMMGCFDERGRLFIAESAGTNRRSPELLADPQDKILMLEDLDGDGVFDKSTVFADKMVFPQGCLWYRGALYTCSSPYLWKLEDTDDDGVCDRRTIVVKSFGFSGNAADIHGPFLGPDGRLYWCDGRHGHEIRDLGDGEFGGEDTVLNIPPDPEPGLPNPDGELLTRGKAARIFSCRPDGSDVQVLCGGGMDNPVEVDFWETGECIGTVNLFYGRPRGDCLVHWVKGGVYPRFDQQACIDEFPWTGGLLGPVHNYGHVAVSGLTRYRSDQFFPESAPNAQSVRDTDAPPDRATFFVTQFNTHKLVKTVLERSGASFRHISTEDFLVSDDPDFHPTDVIEDADGSLLLIDTGGWFRIGCPTSQVAKPEIAGAIYRIRREGTHDVGDPRAIARELAREPIENLIRHLDDPAPVVRNAAIEEITRHDLSAVNLLTQTARSLQSSQRLRVNAARALGRINPGNTLGNLNATLKDPDPQVRLVSAASFKDVRDAHAVGWLVHYAQNEYENELRLAAVDALASICDPLIPHQMLRVAEFGNPNPRPPSEQDIQLAVEGLATAGAQCGDDRVLMHAVIHALIRTARPEATAAYLNHSDPDARRAALIALDQMEGGNLTRDQVLPLLDTNDVELQETVLTVISRRDGWAAATVDLLGGWIGESELSQEREAILRSFLTAQAGDADIQRLIADSLQDAEIPVETRLVLLEIAERAAVDAFPDSWDVTLEQNLEDDDARLRLQAIRTIRAHERSAFDADLLSLAEDQTAAADLRIEAFSTIARRLDAVPDGVFSDQVLMLAGETDAVDKLRIARGLADAPLNESQLGMLADSLVQIGSTATPLLLAAFERIDSEDVGRRLVAGLESQGDSLRISAPELARILGHYPQSVKDQAAGLFDRLGVDLEEQAARLEELMPLTEEGNPDVGHYLFFGAKAACGRCHRIGDEGAQVGPDLSKIASIRQPRDLLEALVFPSASFARGFRPYTVLSLDGRVESGLIVHETAQHVVLQTTDLRRIRYERDEIEAIAESTTSIMPQGLETQLSADELRNLLAYLQSLK